MTMAAACDSESDAGDGPHTHSPASPPMQLPFDDAQLSGCVTVLRALEEHPMLRGASNEGVREVVLLCKAIAGVTAGPGLTAREKRKNRRKLQRDNDEQLLNRTGIKQLREFRANPPLTWDGSSMPLVRPDFGEAMMVTFGDGGAASGTVKAITNGEEGAAAMEVDANGDLKSSSPAPAIEDVPDTKHDNANDNGEPLLSRARKCHVCHAEFRRVHHFYDQLCEECSDLNYAKRMQKIDIGGKVALVTGARVKIGFCVALKLLRSGAFVIAATRFPKDALNRYRMEHDFAEWKHRLRVYGLDFRDIPMVHHFCDHIKRTYPRLDMIINNAAQTVRRPPAFYRHLLEEEMRVPGDGDRELLVDYHHYEPRDAFILKANKDQAPAPALPGIAPVVQASIVNVEEGTATTAATENSDSLLSVTTAGPSKKAKTEGSIGGVCTSVLLSQVALMQGDEDQATDLFPPGRYDIDNQQVDLRSQNSWTMRIGEVSTVELIECHAINAFAPWVLCSELRSMLADKSQGDDWVKDGRYIVNVSAMEAQFYRHKTPGHPHTNMAKASLNMLTRTSAQDFLQDGIYLNSVDTGWITDENCAGMSKMHSDCPLDEWDAALRILDPVFEGIRNPENRHFGLFLKNYKPTRW